MAAEQTEVDVTSFLAHLREGCAQKGTTIEQLGAELGLGSREILSWVADNKMPLPPLWVRRYAQPLGLDPDRFLHLWVETYVPTLLPAIKEIDLSLGLSRVEMQVVQLMRSR